MNLSEFPLVEFRIRSWILTVALVNSRISSLEWCSCTNSILSHFFWAFKWIWANRGRIKETQPTSTYLVSCQEKTAPFLFSIGVNTVQSFYYLYTLISPFTSLSLFWFSLFANADPSNKIRVKETNTLVVFSNGNCSITIIIIMQKQLDLYIPKGKNIIIQ